MTLLLRTPLVLDAATRNAAAASQVAEHPPGTPVVIIVRDGVARRYHTTTAEALAARLTKLPKAGRLADSLPSEQAAATMQLGDYKRATAATFNGVLLDGYQVYAVVGEPGKAAPPGSRGGPPAPPLVAPQAAPPPEPPAAAAPAPAPASEPASASPPKRAAGRKRATSRAEPPGRGMEGAGPPLAGAEPPASEATTGVAPAATERLTGHAFVDAPAAVREEDSIDVTIGLAAKPVEGVEGGAMSIELEAGTKIIQLDVQIAASGFSAPAGWRRTLDIEVANPYAARASIKLTALRLPAEEDDPAVSLLTVHYSYKGVPAGVATRRIAIQRRAGARVAAVAPDPVAVTAPVLVDAAAVAQRPDIVIRISPRDDTDSGRYILTFDPSPDVTLPAEPVPLALGKDPASFARGFINEVTQNEGQPSLDSAMRGQGVHVADKIPATVWQALRDAWTAVHDKTGRVPTLLLMSAEAHVPWELARFPEPVPDKTKPPFLAAQFAMARWILSPNVAPSPSLRHDVDHIAVVIGEYGKFGRLPNLKFAEDEKSFLQTTYKDDTIALTASNLELTQLMAGQIPVAGGPACSAEIVHFACHGDVTGTNPPAAVLYLSDGKTFSSTLFLDSDLGRASKPFLFLNACKVGAAVTQLGDYAGFAGDCLRAGFSGVLAPLWSVEDGIAHGIAEEFYKATLPESGDAKPVAEVLTGIRSRYAADPVTARHSTYLAYVFYGHPNLMMART
ncbi:MAG TPA: CHAT domain-containing protein [Gemmatimonadaceae bacterium]|nr:CHAT domain-containing protein [Gemmatimonadaceae bacterium]